MESQDDEMITLSNGEIVMWIINSTLHLKCVTQYGDPVELNAEEVSDLLETLKKCLLRMN